jgi:hypothetical protein
MLRMPVSLVNICRGYDARAVISNQDTGGSIFPSWSTVLLLALESSEVIGRRIAKLAAGDRNAQHEAYLIFSEKIVASIEVWTRLASGATTSNLVERFREQVAANASRLSKEWPDEFSCLSPQNGAARRSI